MANDEPMRELLRGLPPEVDVVRGLLDGAGIHYVVHGSTGSGLEPAMGSESILLVGESDYARAKELLDAEPEPAELAPAKKDHGSPRCTRHDRESTGPCVRCGTFLCEACGDECPSCAENKANAVPERRGNTRRIIAIVVLATMCGVPAIIAALIQALFRH